MLFTACASYPKKNNFQERDTSEKEISLPYFSSEAKDYVYKANIEVYGNTLSGLFIVKKLGESNHRIVFTTEMGKTIFDFSFLNNVFTVNYIIDDIDKSILINILKRDFQVLIQEKFPVIASYESEDGIIYETVLGKRTYYYSKTKLEDKIVYTRNGKEKIRFLFSDVNGMISNKISILHTAIKLEINLKTFN
ncbi:hypothetical protein [Dokdonia sp.]|uniref:hypothetical protein n=1 Tax=Dokdonia sp. TaxID=2024995 RepID=UPI003264D334